MREYGFVYGLCFEFSGVFCVCYFCWSVFGGEYIYIGSIDVLCFVFKLIDG